MKLFPNKSHGTSVRETYNFIVAVPNSVNLKKNTVIDKFISRNKIL